MTNKDILIDIPMPIYTPRLIIRPPQPGDGKAVAQAKDESRQELAKWMWWATKQETAGESEAMLRAAYADFILRKDMMLLGFHRKTGEMIVSTGLHRFDWSIRKFEIGYWTRTGYHNQGYATETANALTRFAFDALAARRVEIRHDDTNDASAKVPQKLGFEYEGKNDLTSSLPDGRIVAIHTYARFNLKNLPKLEVTW